MKENYIYLAGYLKLLLLISKYSIGTGNFLYHSIKATKKNKMECYVRKRVVIGGKLLSSNFDIH